MAVCADVRVPFLTLLAVVTALSGTPGCGSQTTDGRADSPASDASLAAAIRDSAQAHKQEPVADAAADSGTTTTRPLDAPPAGQEGIDESSDDEDETEATSASTSRHTYFSAGDRKSFEALSRSLGGRSGVAVSALGMNRPVQALGSLRTGIAWSTSKVPLAMAVIAAGRATTDAANLKQTITASDNAAAERLWADLGDGATAARRATDQLRAVGDERTQIQSRRLRPGFTPFGQTMWRMSDQVRFTAGLACVAAGAQVLGLMNRTVSAQRWGLGSAGVPAQLKGGWGPGARPGVNGGYLDRQMGVLQVRRKHIAVAIATIPADGRHETGTANLTAIARWVVAHIDVTDATDNPRCR